MDLKSIMTAIGNSQIDADIYVSYQGDDANNGTTPLLAIRTLTRLKQIIANGYVVAFKCGGHYYGEFSLNGYSNITFTNYGSGNKPIISALVENTNVGKNGNIYSVTDTSLYDESIESKSGPNPDNVYYLNSVYHVIANGAKHNKAVWPKTGYLTASGGGTSTLVDGDIGDASGYWDWCEVISYPYYWYAIRSRVSSFNGTTFSYQHPARYNAYGSKYKILNHINALTLDGEYCYNPSTKTISVYSSANIDSISYGYTSNYGKLFELLNCDSVTIRGIDFEYAPTFGVNIDGCSNCHVINSSISNCGSFGIRIYNSSLCDVTGSTVTDCYGGILLQSSSNIDVLKTKISNICNDYIGQVDSDCSNGVGIYIAKVQSVNVENCEISETSMGGLNLYCSGDIKIINNYIHDCVLKGGDLGYYYAFGCSQEFTSTYSALTDWRVYITGNIAEVKQVPSSTDLEFIGLSEININPIYIDSVSSDTTITDNTAIGGMGTLFVKGKGHVMSGNKIININTSTVKGRTACYFIDDTGNSGTVPRFDFKNNIFNNNIVITIDYIEDDTLMIEGYQITIAESTGNTFSGNKYYNPLPHSANTQDFFYIRSILMNISEWISDDVDLDWNRETEAVITPSIQINSSKPKLNYVYVITNPSTEAITVTLANLPYSDYIDLNGVDFGTSRIINPYDSLILVRREI